ncbi:unnamed protein product [Rotaria sp. Silwood1]|nr:unnamed protein product [Rotaria sp. Silwood1]CAF4567554.1 unnamed protein product [Rotaria sp. Silwood1]
MTLNSTSFRGAIALITGGNKGIGFETARQLGEQGLTVLIAARDKTRGEEAVRMLENENIQAKWVELDVTRQETIDNAAQQVFNDYGRLDILINNAGIRLEGLAKTDMNNNTEAYPSPSKAAQAIVHFATLPNDGPSGAFFDSEKNEMPW